MGKVSTDDAYLIVPEYTDDERLVGLDESSILDFVAESTSISDGGSV